MRVDCLSQQITVRKNNSYIKQKNNTASYKISPAITFLGKERNPNQVAILATECVPYTVSGGLGSVTRDMTKAYKDHYSEKDLRLILPYYNSLSNVDIEYTGIKTDFHYGVRQSTASLIKIKNPESGVPTYFVDFPELNNLNKEYSLDDYSLFEKYAAFSFASMAILNKMKDSKEDFNPKILHTKDWHTTYAQFAKDEKQGMKSIHELLNANSNFHGKINPLAAALNIFSMEQIDRLKSSKEFKREIFTLTINNPDILLKGIRDRNNDSLSVNKLMDDPESMNIILRNLAENYTQILNKRNNYYSHVALNDVVRNTFKEINWDENQDFNPTVNAIKESDGWFTISDAHFHELLEDPYFSSLSLYNMLRLNLNKGAGILNRIDLARYNPSNPEQVKHPFNVETFKDGKQKNKEFLFEQFSQENISNRSFDKRIMSNQTDALVFGYLDKKYQNDPLVVNISRFDTNQKGSDLALDMARKLLDEDEKVNFIFGLPNFNNAEPKMLEKFVREVVENPKYKGRIVLIDAYLPINQYLAGADISVIPSRSETCGLVGYQSMRMGAIPVSSPVGSMKDCLITPEQDSENAMGFLTPVHFAKSQNPSQDLTNTIKKALNIYGFEQFDKMIQNSMKYNSDWSSAILKQNNFYDKVLNGEKINDLEMSDISVKDYQHNLKIFRRDDISKLPESDLLVFMAHPDDEVFFLPLLKYLEQGKSVQIVYAAKGEKGHQKKGAPTTPDDLAKHREYEMLNALNCLGITRNPLKLDYPDLEIFKPENSQELSDIYRQIIEQVKPKMVFSFGPDGITGNPDHKKVGEIAYNATLDFGIPTYQTGISSEYFDTLLKSTQNTITDAFDFITPAQNNNPVTTVNLSEYADKIKKSIQAHQSQWSEEEVQILTDFYTKAPAEMFFYSQYPNIGEAKNPWVERAQEFQNKYGSEFTPINGGVCFYPQNDNLGINLYIADEGRNRKHLWVESSFMNSVESAVYSLKKILRNIDKIKNIPQFSSIEYIDLRIGPKTKSTLNISDIDKVIKTMYNSLFSVTPEAYSTESIDDIWKKFINEGLENFS